MYPHMPAGMPNFPQSDGNRATLAKRCAAGDHAAGVQLVELLWKEEHAVTIDTVMRVARTAGVLTAESFDHLYDAFTHANLRRYKREHGIKDPEPEPEPVESD